MIAFDINGALIKFDEQRDNYNTITNPFTMTPNPYISFSPCYFILF